MTDSSRTDYGWITVEDTGNTSIHANFTYDHNGPDLNSKGEPTLEATEWLIDDFYLQHEGKKYSLASKTIRYTNDIPRHAEVINDRVFLLYGSQAYPASEALEEKIKKNQARVRSRV